MTVSPGSRLGPYEILAPLGAGGMGEVWRARDTRLAREVAIKVLPAEVAADPSRLKRFEKEARSASALNHPNIVTIYDIGSSDSVSYIAMELVEGKTLRELLFGGALPVKRVLSIGAQVAEALSRAHEVGIVHRDLKPENVMVTKDGLAKILDFGLAKLTEPEPERGQESVSPTVSAGTEPGVVMGTVSYMSPEQALGKPVDFRSDQFSFGSMLYEMTTGRRAFARRSAPETLTAIIREEPEPVASLSPQTPAPLRWIVERCLAKDPEDRYASTKDLARELATVRDHLTEASGPSPVAPAPRRIRVAGLLVLAVVRAAFVGVFLLARQVGDRPPPSFRQLTFRSGEVNHPRFASDGQTIVYSATWGAEPLSIFSTRTGGVESRALGAPGADLLSISASGEMLVLRDGTLARVSMTGGGERELLEGVLDAAWAPNGTDIAVVRQRGAIGSRAQPGTSGARLEFPVGKVRTRRPAAWRRHEFRLEGSGGIRGPSPARRQPRLARNRGSARKKASPVRRVQRHRGCRLVAAGRRDLVQRNASECEHGQARPGEASFC